MSGLEIFLVTAFIGMGAMVQGCVGIGIGLVAAPMLVSIDPAFAPGPILFAAQVVGLRHIVAEREHTDFDAMKNCLWGIPVGMAIGLAVLIAVDERTLSIIVGAVVAVGCLALLAGLTVARSRKVEITTGGLVAFSSVTAGLPGPPLVAAFSEMKPSEMRGTASSVIVVVAALAAVTLVLSGEFGSEELRLLLMLVPGVLIGLLAAQVLRPYLDRSWFRTAVLIVACAGGIALVIRQLV